MRKLTIYRLFFSASDCYTAGVKQKPRGVQVHSTGANNPRLKRYVQPDDGRLGQNRNGNSHNRAGGDVCASAYIGKLENGSVAVYQALPWDMRCWLSANGDNGNANKLGYIGFEICEDGLTDEAYFKEAVLGASVNLTAHLCQTLGISPYDVVDSYRQGDALAVMDHSELARLELASGHSDITHWLDNFGMTMDDYRAEVQKAMDEGIEATYIDAIEKKEGPAMYQAKVTSPGAYLNLRVGWSTDSESIAKLRKGTVVDVLDDSTGVWWYVQHEGVTGFAMSENDGVKYLTPLEESEGEAPPEPDVVTVSIDRETARALYAALGDALNGG